jgi:chorismate mutase-like protein
MTPIERCRDQIDQIDGQLMALLAARFEVCLQVGRLKETMGLPMMQNGRIVEVLRRTTQKAAQHGVSLPFAETMWRMIIEEACRLERDTALGPRS